MDLSTLGNLLLALASISALGSIAAISFTSFAGKSDTSRITGHVLTFVSTAFTSLATLLLLTGFLGENFKLEYVAYNHPTIVGPWSWLYKVSGVWAGREGSLLFWAWLLSLFAAWVAYRFLSKRDRLATTALGIMNFVQLFFLTALFIPLNNPFKLLPPEYLDPTTGKLLIEASMNPLLQTWAMIAHPPTLFLGYAGLTVPFAFALAALFTGDTSKHWVQISDRIAVFSWLMLGIGIGLGAVWAYIELAFGGYWAWDPVENASLLPWLTGVGLLHSMTVYRKRDGFRAWTIFMAAVTFVFVLLGTFITRSGIVTSVHAFQEDPLSFWLFLSMMVGSLGVAVVGIWIRRDKLKSDDSFDRLFSKEGSYYFNNVIMLVAAVMVAYLTLSQALPKWLPGGGQVFGAATYDILARPVGIFYILVMSVCPILSWGGAGLKGFMDRAKWPIGGAAVLGTGFIAIWAFAMMPYYAPTATSIPLLNHTVAIIGLLVAALSISLPIYLFIDGARKRAAAKGESFGGALLNILTKARSQSGGYLTHLGMGIILVGLIGSTMYVRTYETAVPQTPGSKVEAGAYTFNFGGIVEAVAANGDEVVTATLDVFRDGKPAGTVKPRVVYPKQLAEERSSTMKVSLIQQPLKDIFVSFNGVDQAGNAVFTVKYFPMQWWVWAGFIVTILGSALASWPKRLPKAA
jgi:cytochrome c-type biogenesis protein CcmF